MRLICLLVSFVYVTGLKFSFTPINAKLASNYKISTAVFSPKLQALEKSSTSLSVTSSSLSAASTTAVEGEKKGLAHTLKVGGFFALW